MSKESKLSKLNAQIKHCKILISACLLGDRVRYDAKINKLENDLIDKWFSQGLLLPVCPEVCGGLPPPRPAAEMQRDGSVKTRAGKDISGAFKRGALKTLQFALENNIKVAILTEKSPSCGSSKIYNGQFEGHLIEGQGLTTQLLRANGIAVFNQFEVEKAQAFLTNSSR